MPIRLPRFQPLPSFALLVGGTLLLSGCSADLESTPEPTATATAVTFDPGDVAVGELMNDASAVWDDVNAWVAETRIETPSGASDESATTSVSTERVILPDQRSILTTNGETIVSEERVVDGVVYMRGTMVPASIYPDVDSETWITFSPDAVPEETLLEQRVQYLMNPPQFPFADVSAETRDLPASPSEAIEMEARSCEAWSFTTATSEQEGIDYLLAFDDEGRPCQLVRSGGGVTETTTWTYPQDPERIETPDDATAVTEFPSEPQ